MELSLWLVALLLLACGANSSQGKILFFLFFISLVNQLSISLSAFCTQWPQLLDRRLEICMLVLKVPWRECWSLEFGVWGVQGVI